MKKIILLLLLSFLFNSVIFSQQDVYWRNDAATSNWWDDNKPWYRSCDGWWLARPDYSECHNNSTIGGNYIHFDNNNQTSMTINGSWFKANTLTFETNATTSRTLTSDAFGGISFTAESWLTNKSSVSHTLSTGIGIDGVSLGINAFNGGFSLTKEIYVNGNALTFCGTYNTTASGVISGTGTLSKQDGGTLTLSGANTYSGLTTVTGGTLKLNHTGGTTIPVTNNVTVSGGTLQISSNQTLANLDLSGGGNLIVDADITLTITGTYTGGSGTINNQGTIILQGSFSQSFPGSSAVINNGTANTMTNLTVDNAAGVSLDNNLILSGTLTINSNKILNVNAGKQLTVNTTMTNNGTLNLLSSSSGTATIITRSVSGSGTTNVNQTLGADRNWYLSSPVSAASIPTADNVWYYDETVVSSNLNDSWKAPTEGTTLEVGKGYIVNPTSSDYDKITFTGTLNSGDLPAVTLRQTPEKSSGIGFNLVGNPYPSYLNANALLNDASNSNVLKTIWYRTNNGSAWSYPTFNADAGIGVPSNISGFIPPMQAFWVRATADNVSFYFKDIMRSHNTSGSTIPFKAPAVAANQILRLQVAAGSITDEAVVYFNANAANGYDSYDSPKWLNGTTSTVPDIYTTAGTEQLVINGMNAIPYNVELPLYFKANASSGSFRLSATEMSNFEAGTNVYVKNNTSLEQKLISDGTVYTFDASEVASDPAFSLIFRAPGFVDAISTASTDQNLQVYRNANNQIAVQIKGQENDAYTLNVYNSIGQRLASKQANAGITVMDAPQSGVYFVTIKGNGTNTTKKVVIN
jgi:autotransporter-associated beta strand protein